MEEPTLSTVHDAMTAAVFSDSSATVTTTISFRLPAHIKEASERICAANSTCLSSFLRECCRKLVQDYKLTKEEE